jgi:hypothetical protein
MESIEAVDLHVRALLAKMSMRQRNAGKVTEFA